MTSVYAGEGAYIKDFARTSVSASPGFAFGAQGNVKNAYLTFNSVPSNNTGALVFLNNAVLVGYSIAVSLSSTFEVEIYEHNTSTFTLKSALTVTSALQGSIALATPVALTTGLRLAVKISNLGACRDPNVQLIIRGDLPL